MFSIPLQNCARNFVRYISNTVVNPKITYDAVQEAALKERCFLVDNNDKIIGHASKKECHLVKDGKIPLHRAFSVFMFNSRGDLLLQKRAPSKVRNSEFYW